MSDIAVTDQTRRSVVRASLESIVLYTDATVIALMFVYPFYWMQNWFLESDLGSGYLVKARRID